MEKKCILFPIYKNYQVWTNYYEENKQINMVPDFWEAGDLGEKKKQTQRKIRWLKTGTDENYWINLQIDTKETYTMCIPYEGRGNC